MQTFYKLPRWQQRCLARQLGFRPPTPPIYARLALAGILAVSVMCVAHALPPKNYVVPLGNNQFTCPEFAPMMNYCTNRAHPHFWLRSNTGTTNCFEAPGGSVGIRS